MRIKKCVSGCAGLLLAAALVMTACGDAEGGPGGGGDDDPLANLAAGLYEGALNADSLPVDLSGQSGDHVLAKAIAYIGDQSLSETTNYTILLDEDCSMSGLPGYSGTIDSPNAVITLRGKKPVEISLSSAGTLFLIIHGTLVLSDNITLTDGIPNSSPLVEVQAGHLYMEAGAKITGNGGHGVLVNGGLFTMNNGEITGNAGTGVYIDDSIFTMKNGKITGNTGGGVAVYADMFNP
jgi:hypothetical protein